MKTANLALYSFLFSLNFEVWDPFYTDGNFSISKLFGFVYVITLLLSVRFKFYIPEKFKSPIRAIFFFWIYLTAVSLLHVNIYSFTFLNFTILQNIALFSLLVFHESICPGVLAKSFKFFALGSLVLCLFYFLSIGVEISTEGRVSIFGDNENILGIRMVFSLLIINSMLQSSEVKLNWLTILGIVLANFAYISLILVTASRVSFISFAAGMIINLIFYKSKSRIMKFFIVVSGLIALLFFVFWSLNSEVLGSRLMRVVDDKGLSNREDIWSQVRPLIESNWLLGVGETGYFAYMVKLTGEYTSPHNVFIEIFAYTGLIGFMIFVVFFRHSVMQSYKMMILYKETVPFVFFVPILGLLLSGQIFKFKLVWVTLAYASSRSLYLKLYK